MDLGRRVGRGQGVRRPVRARPAAPGSTTRSRAGQNARTAGINRIVGGDPPTAMQFNTGLQFDEVVGNGFLRDLEEVAAAGNWREVLPEAIIKATNARGQVLRGTGQHPWPELALVQHRRAGAGRRRAAERLPGHARDRAEAQGGRRGPAGVRRRAELGAVPVQLGAAGPGRQRALPRRPRQQGHRRGQQRQVPRGRRDLRRAARAGRRGQPRAQVERRHQHGDHRPGGDAGDGRLGQGRVHRRRHDRGRGVWLHDPRRRRGGRLHHGRRRVRLPPGRRSGRSRRRRRSSPS